MKLLNFLTIIFLSFSLKPCISQEYHVKDFNATGDGKSDDTLAVRAALAAAAASNGGRVIFDENYIFLTGAFNVTSNVILDVRGIILASNNSDEFNYPLMPPLPWYGGGTDAQKSGKSDRQSVLQSYNATNITLTGGGIVNGQGYPWWDCSYNLTSPPCNGISRPNFVRFIHSSNIIVHNITLKDCTAWCLHLAWVTTAHIYNINIITPNLPIAHNTDGIDIDCSVDVLVENCYYTGSDDAVAVKSGIDYLGRTYGRTSENIIVRNFTIFNAKNSGMSIGSEMSGGVRNVTFHDVFANGTGVGARIKSRRGRGGVVENITFNNFRLYNVVKAGIQFYCQHTGSQTNDTGTPKFKNIKVTNFYIEDYGWYLMGIPESPYRNLHFSNITVNKVKHLIEKCDDMDGFCDNSSVIPSCPNCLNAGCPTDWTQSNVNSNQCYRLYNNSLSWNSALYTCQNSTLTSLISVDNAFENGAINNYINTTNKNCHKVYIGLQKMGDTWEWTNGDNSKYRNWETNYPINDTSNSCAVLNINDGRWTNQDCSIMQCFICAFTLNTSYLNNSKIINI